VEFLVDVYRHPPDWMQCIFHLRLIAFLLYVVVLSMLLIKPSRVMQFIPGVGIRLTGGAIAPAGIICPIIAILSLYMLLYSLEPRGRAVFFFLIGLTGTIITRSRTSEITLALFLAIVGALWARGSKRFASMLISGFMAFLLLFGLVAESFGGEHLWNVLNRNQSVEGITSASGRTDIWKFIIQYCMVHPQGMGYEAGFRLIFREYSAPGLLVNPVLIGNAHNAFMQVLADAGWVAFAAYLVMMAKLVALGLRFAKKRTTTIVAPGNADVHALRCALVLLIFCFADGVGGSDYLVPLRSAFYLQNIIVAIILGISANMLNASRSLNADETGNRNDSCIDPL
jgi:O-antigen ligase